VAFTRMVKSRVVNPHALLLTGPPQEKSRVGNCSLVPSRDLASGTNS
jgi:hypothetical protein